MNTYRNAAASLAVWAACLSLAACSAGITTAGTDAAASSRSAAAAASASSSAAAASAAASASASASAAASRAAAGRMIKVAGLSASIPVPTGANVVENMATNVDGKQTLIFFGRVTPAAVDSFYAEALPRHGYKVTGSSLDTQSGGTMAFIQFSGHGIKGTIETLAEFNDSSTGSAGFPGLGRKNVTSITISPR